MALEEGILCTISHGRVFADIEQQSVARIPPSAPVPSNHLVLFLEKL